MTRRRFRFTYRLRIMLICVACISFLFAIFVHFDTAGRKQLSAALSIKTLGGHAFPANSSIEFQQVTYSGPNGEPQETTRPVVRIHRPSQLNQLGRTIFGDAMFSDFSTILVQRPVTSQDDFQRYVFHLPNLNTIYYYENALQKKTLDEISNQHPGLKLEKLPGSLTIWNGATVVSEQQ